MKKRLIINPEAYATAEGIGVNDVPDDLCYQNVINGYIEGTNQIAKPEWCHEIIDYERGDRVRIKEKPGMYDENCKWFEKYKGKVLTIDALNCSRYCYTVKEDPSIRISYYSIDGLEEDVPTVDKGRKPNAEESVVTDDIFDIFVEDPEENSVPDGPDNQFAPWKVVIQKDPNDPLTTVAQEFDQEDKVIESVCYHSDENSYWDGVIKALTHFRDKYELFTGSAVCVKEGMSHFTRGMIYDFVDGIIIYDEGEKEPMDCPMTNMMINDTDSYGFLEIVE